MAVLIFVGVDKTGKSTLFKEVLKKTNRHICIDRFAPCQVVYGKHHHKGYPKLHSLELLEKHLSNSPIPFVYVFVKANIEIIKQRFQQHDENDIEIDQIETIQNEYMKYLSDTWMDVFEVDTTSSSILRCTSLILEYADNLDRIWKL